MTRAANPASEPATINRERMDETDGAVIAAASVRTGAGFGFGLTGARRAWLCRCLRCFAAERDERRFFAIERDYYKT